MNASIQKLWCQLNPTNAYNIRQKVQKVRPKQGYEQKMSAPVPEITRNTSISSENI